MQILSFLCPLGMGVERLKWLVWLCNFSGLLPFRMILRKDRFSHFEFKWKHPVTLWMFLIQMGHAVFLTLFLLDSIYVQIKAGSSLFPKVFMLATAVVQLSIFVNMNSPLLIIFHVKKLRTVIKSLQHVDRVIDTIPNADRCTTERRIVIGLFFTLIGV